MEIVNQQTKITFYGLIKKVRTVEEEGQHKRITVKRYFLGVKLQERSIYKRKGAIDAIARVMGG